MTKKSTGKVEIELNAKFDDLIKGLDKASNAVLKTEKRMAGAFDKMGKVATATLGLAGVFAIKKLSDSITELANRGDKLDAVTDSFTKLGGSTSEIQKAQDALLGTVSKIDLMTIANQGLIKQIPGFKENFTQIAILGNKVADALGIEATQGIEKVTKALAEGKTKQLESIGIVIDAEQVYKNYAQSIGVSADKLSEYQKREARQIQAIKELSNAQSRYGEIADSVTDASDAVNIAMKDGFDIIGQGINNNEELTKAYRELQEVIKKIDWQALGTQAGNFFAILARSASTILPPLIKLLSDASLGFEGLFGASTLAQATQTADKIEEIKNKIQEVESNRNSVTGAFLGIGSEDQKSKLAELNQELTTNQKKHADLQAQLVESIKARKALTTATSGNNAIIVPNINLTGESTKATAEHEKALAKLNKEIDAHNLKWNEMLSKDREDLLGEKIKESIDSLNYKDFDNLVDKLEKSVKEGFLEEWKEAVKVGAKTLEEVTDKAEEVAKKAGDSYRKEMSIATEETAQEMTDAYAQVFDNVGGFLNQISNQFGFDFSNILNTLSDESKSKIMQNIGSAFGFDMSETGAQELDDTMSALSTNISALTTASEKDRATNSNQGTGGAVGAGLGTTVGAIFGGAEGAKIGSAIGQTAGEIIGSFIGRGSQNPGTIARKEFINFMEDSLKKLGQVSFYNSQGKLTNTSGANYDFLDTDASRFSLPDWGASMKEWGDGAEATFIGLGQALEETLGLTEDVGGQIGFLLGEQLSGNLDNARLLVQQLGLSFEELESALVQTGLSGEMRWHEVEVAIQGVSSAFEKGKVAIGDVAGAMYDLVDSGGRGIGAIKAVRDSATEAMEKGATSIQEMGQQMIAMGVDPTLVQDYLDAIASRGIKTLEELENASDRLAGGVVADLESNNEAIRKQWEQMTSDLKGLAETIEKIPTEKDIEINVKTNFDSNTESFLNSDLATNDATGRSQALAPTTEIGTTRKVRSFESNSLKAGNVYHIDARGADIGVEQRIRSALREVEERAVRRSINSIAENNRRGGRF